MKIDLDAIDTEQFMKRPFTIHGRLCYLIIPNHIGAVWTKDNLHLRSSIWDEHGYLVSAGFPKFFNWGEKDNIIPPPNHLMHANIVEKLDGPTLIFSWLDGKPIIRTRGTVTIDDFDNASDLPILLEKYPKMKELQLSGDSSIIFEWYSPANRIVLNMGDEPDMFLIGLIRHSDYRLEPQAWLDNFAEFRGLKRPTRYTFSTITELCSNVEGWINKEGVCIYYNHDQNIKKLKGLWYLKLHAFKSECTLDNVLDLYVQFERPDFNTFLAKIEEVFDFECAQMAMPFISSICDANKVVDKIVAHMHKFVYNLAGKARKDQAEEILSAYGKTNRSGYVFTLLDGKPLDAKAYKKLLHQTIGQK